MGGYHSSLVVERETRLEPQVSWRRGVSRVFNRIDSSDRTLSYVNKGALGLVASVYYHNSEHTHLNDCGIGILVS